MPGPRRSCGGRSKRARAATVRRTLHTSIVQRTKRRPIQPQGAHQRRSPVTQGRRVLSSASSCWTKPLTSLTDNLLACLGSVDLFIRNLRIHGFRCIQTLDHGKVREGQKGPGGLRPSKYFVPVLVRVNACELHTDEGLATSLKIPQRMFFSLYRLRLRTGECLQAPVSDCNVCELEAQTLHPTGKKKRQSSESKQQCKRQNRQQSL